MPDEPGPLPPVTVKVTSTSSKVSAPPPMVDLKVTNPIVYIKAWWKKVIGNEGIKLTLQIKPLTAAFLIIVFCSLGFGFGRLSLPGPFNAVFPASPTPTSHPTAVITPRPTDNPWIDTAYTGKLQYSANRYYLVTQSSQAITLDVPGTLNLQPLVGKRILVSGTYNPDTKVMRVSDTTNLEILPAKPSPAPTVLPTLNPSL